MSGEDSGATVRTAPIPGLIAPVSVMMDAAEVPTIQARSEADAYRALGALHATHRFAQMDMMRRFAAGETAELLGQSAVAADKEKRALRGRDVARACVQMLDARERALLGAYVEGVNAGVAALPALPIEHMLLGVTPAPWRDEDCVLVYLSMFHSLSRSGRADAIYADARDHLPPALLDFVASPLSRWDCPVIAEASPPAMPPIPDEHVIDLRGVNASAMDPPAPKSDAPKSSTPMSPPKSRKQSTSADPPHDLPQHAMERALHQSSSDDADQLAWLERAACAGSNAWVVSGARTTDGRAILANDPHLMITAPILWYRCRLQWPDVDWMGLSIPGMPGIVIGTNGQVAVGYTNTTGDFEDLVEVEVDPADPSRYLTPEGSERFGTRTQTIEVRGSEPVTYDERTTRWGTVTGSRMGSDGVERPTVTLWVGARPDAINFRSLGMASAKSVDEAVQLLSSWYGPSQNAMLADAQGHIGWVATGWIPDRRGHDPRVPWRPSVDGEPWLSGIDPELRPSIVDPPEGVIVTANHRAVPLDACGVMGYYWANPERAHRVQELLAAPGKVDESRCVAMQLDTRVEGLEPYRAFVLRAIPQSAASSDLASIRAAVAAWNGRADADQPAVAFLTSLQRSIDRRLTALITAWAVAQQGGGGFRLRAVHDEPWLRLIEAQPAHWLPEGVASWDAFLLDAIREAADKDPADAAWGERNRAKFASPVADAVPKMMKSMVTLDDGPQSGHFRAVRVHTQRAAASARLVVSPGHESDGILQTPGGQSGDPRSPHYRSLHAAWREGTPTPLLPAVGAPLLVFTPALP